MKRKIIMVLLILLVLFWAGFIFSNSMEDLSASYETSARFIRMVNSHLLDNAETAYLAQNYFRKAAHFFEFFTLGILLYLLLSGKEKRGMLAFLFSAAAAFLDEGLQMFSDRGNSLRDVLLDSCGAAAGILLVSAIIFLIKKVKSGRSHRDLS